eukprot:TRINITY_DN3179_c0_g3_i1.p1 TRINITY_DN3179_c0_g3~~TRINITY_DN3179_c0_g3_i1.p1  ORF type:complete len:623 (+),score=96.77 TRINITY_DN3179_c0_g3_i1:160-2028(+)
MVSDLASYLPASSRIHECIRTDLAELRQQIGADLQKLLDDRGILQTSSCHGSEVEEKAVGQRPLALRSYTSVKLTNESEMTMEHSGPAKKLSALTRKMTEAFGMGVKRPEADTPARSKSDSRLVEPGRINGAECNGRSQSPRDLENGPSAAWADNTRPDETNTSKDRSSDKQLGMSRTTISVGGRITKQFGQRFSLSLDTTAGLGLREKTRKERLADLDDSMSCFRKNAERLARSQKFEAFIMVVIFANSVLVGVQTEAMAHAKTVVVPTSFRTIDLVYLGVCIAELVLRIYVHGWAFFYMWGWVWNIFDLTIVVGQILEEFLLLLQSLASVSDGGLTSSLSMLSIVRLLRALRVVRVMRVLQRAHSLRLIVSCILYSVRPLFWSAVVISAMTYIYAIYITQLVTSKLLDLENVELSADDKSNADLLTKLYGTLFSSALSLFQGITGGLDWDELVRPIIKLISPMTGLLIVLYIGFALLAVMNVVTGLFVENAIARAQEVRQLTLVSHARRVFEDLDLDTSGTITFDELQAHLDSDSVQDYFKAIDIHISEAKMLFEIMDQDGSGTIDFTEFLQGCLRLQGPARAVDLFLSSRESKRAHAKTLSSLGSLRTAVTSARNNVQD